MDKQRILIVDDEPSICRGLKKELSDAGYSVDSAGECNEALEKMKETKYDLVFVDLVLPDQDGIETCKAIKAISPQTELVFMTGMLKEDPIFKEMQFIEAGGQTHFLYKPFFDGEILDVAQKVLEVQEKL